ncbi:hypothetical protein PRIEUP_LOCUS1832, partial [Pristimantis euphronides]
MRSWELSVLLFSAVTLHGCVSNTAESEVQDEKFIKKIVDFYNQKEGVTYLYKSLDQLPSVPMEDNKSPHTRAYILQETMCLKSENPDLSQCDFKPDGGMMICAQDVDDKDPLNIICINMKEDVRVKRSRRRKCKKFLCNL